MRATAVAALFLLLSSGVSGQIPPNTYTFAGGALPENIATTSASLRGPTHIAVDASGNVFFADANHVVLRLDATTGLLTVAAGNGTSGFSGDNGPANTAQLYSPRGVALDSAGNLYIADAGNNRIRKVSNGVITTVAGSGALGFLGDNGPATSASIDIPQSVAVDSAGNLYIADTGNHRIRKVAGGVITTVAGWGDGGYGGDDGPATSAKLHAPYGVAVDSGGDIYIADTGNNRIRKVASGIITTVAGNGTYGYSDGGGNALNASLGLALGVSVDGAGNLFIADTNNNRIRKVTNGSISTVAGSGASGFGGDNGPATGAQLMLPQGVATDSSGRLFIADSSNNRIRKVANSVITTVAGNGTDGYSGDGGLATAAQLHAPLGIAFDPARNVYIADYAAIRRVTHEPLISSGVISTVAGTGSPGYSGDGGPATSVRVQPGGIAVDTSGDVYFTEVDGNRVHKVSNGVITTIAGNGARGYSGDNGPATGAQLAGPRGIAVDSAGNVYVSDTENSRIRMISNGVITTVAGNGTAGYSGDGGPATSAQLSSPRGLAISSAGNLYVADSFNQRVRMVSDGTITTVAGNGSYGYSGDYGPATGAQLFYPHGVALDPYGNLYIADTENDRVREVVNGVILTIAGNGTEGYSGDGGPPASAQFRAPEAIAVDGSLFVYIADSQNDRIRVALGTARSCPVTVTPLVATVVPAGGDQIVTVQTSSSCPWAIQGLPGWITYSGNAVRTGSGSVTFIVNANIGAARTAQISIAGAYVAVSQQASSRASLSVSLTHGGNFLPGQNGAVYTIAVSNAIGAEETDGSTVRVTETMPAGMTLVSMSGAGWSCPAGGASCFRSDVLPAGAAYPPITATVNVASNVTSPQVNQVSVSGGGSCAASATDSTTISNAVTAGSVAAGPGLAFRIPITLSLANPASVDTLTFGLQITPAGSAPPLTGFLKFVPDSSITVSPFASANGTANSISVVWASLSPSLSGTHVLGVVSGTIPATAALGQSYSIAITGAGAAYNSNIVAVGSGADGTLTVATTYAAGDAYPYTSDAAPQFGDGSLDIRDLIQVLFAANRVPGFVPAQCSDRLDAMDLYPADTATARGGDGSVDIRDLILELFRVNSLDTSRPLRASTGNSCAPGASAGTLLPVSRRRGETAPGTRTRVSGSLVLGGAEPGANGMERAPIYLQAAETLDEIAVSFGLGDLRSELRFVAAPGLKPSLLEDNQTGAIAAAWLNGISVPAGGRVLLGYVTGEAGTLRNLNVYGVSASGLQDHREVQLEKPEKPGTVINN
jgi:trimeric autotransporter adhesin